MASLRKLAALAWCSLAALPGLAQTALPEPVQAALRQAQIPESSLSAIVLPLEGNTPLLSYRADQSMAPASAMKLLTTVVALDELGPTFRWRTQLLGMREVSGATLRGPLYLRGGGDPHLGWSELQRMLRDLRAQGVRHLRGDILLDRGYFTPPRPDLGASPFDESPDAYYNVIPDALLLDSNLLELDLRSDARRVRVQLRTPLQGVQVHTHQTLTDGNCKDWDDDWATPEVRQDTRGTVRITLLGRFPRQCSVSTTTNVLDRNLFVERAVRALWRELGGIWTGKLRDGNTPADAQVLVEHASDTLADIVKPVNKRSDNAMARTLFLTLGATYTGAPPPENHFDAATARVRHWLQRHDIHADSLVLDNGSGLSRRERLSAQLLARVLQAGARSPWFSELATSLPIAALDGGMRKRLHGTPAALQARIKTGTLRDVAAVAGYVQDVQGRRWVLVGLINDPAARQGRAALDALIAWVAESASTPSP